MEGILELREYLTLAALLSEMGRVCIRSGRNEYRELDPDQATVSWLKHWDNNSVKDIVTALSEESSAKIINLARSVTSACEPGLLKETPESGRVALANLLSQISVTSREGEEKKVSGPGAPYSFPLRSLSEGVVFPAPTAGTVVSAADYDALLTHFERDFQTWLASGGGIGPLIMALENRFHCAPLCPHSENADGGAVGLFDHVRVTAALAAALQRFNEADETASAGT